MDGRFTPEKFGPRELLAHSHRVALPLAHGALDRFKVWRAQAIAVAKPGRPGWPRWGSALTAWLPDRSNRYVAVCLVIALHIAAIWTLATSLRFVRIGDEIRETSVNLMRPIGGSAAPAITEISPLVVQPQAIAVSEPQFQIAQQPSPPSTVTAVDLSQMLPPRPDPMHTNLPPVLPARFRSLGSSVSAVLRIFVLADGSVTDAQVSHSTGDSALDAMAIAYVKENWRFIAAYLRGRPFPDWTTVLVPFKAA